MHFHNSNDAIVITFINENCILAQVAQLRCDMLKEKIECKKKKMEKAIKKNFKLQKYK